MEPLSRLSEPLDDDQIEFMPKTLFHYNGIVKALIIPYKNSRTDMQKLDEICGHGGWQNEYKRDSQGVLQCGIGIWSIDREQWVWKWSNGVKSAQEKEKGEYSDAFKRAGFMWGIGRRLYDFPRIVVTLMETECTEDSNGKWKATNRLRPNDWRWEVSVDRQRVQAFQTINGEEKTRVDTQPHKKQYK